MSDSERERRSYSVWLNPRHQIMLEEMTDVQISAITRKAIEEQFAGRNDREYTRLVLEERLDELGVEWENLLGVNVSHTITSTEDGFRIVLVATKNYSKETISRPVDNPVLPRSSWVDGSDDFDFSDDEE